MKFTKTGARSSNYATKVNLLVEALPWIKHTTGKTVLIKYGGSAMENPELMAQVMTDIVLPKNHRDEANHRAWRRQRHFRRIREKRHARRIQRRPACDAR